MEKFQLFNNVYNSCASDPNKYLSKNFINYIDKLLPKKFLENPLRKAMLTGYVLRCAENQVSKFPLKEPDEEIKKFLNTQEKHTDKIENIANYLDNHSLIGLSERVSPYYLIPQSEAEEIFKEYAENFINHFINENKLSHDKSQIFYELAYRNMSFGYLYKLSEEFVNKN